MTLLIGELELVVDPPAIPVFEGALPSPEVIVPAPAIPTFAGDSPPSGEVVILPVPGIPGPAGAPGGSRYVHTQSSPAATWTVVHNLGRKPAVVLELASNPAELVYTDVTYPDLNTVVVEWPSAETGKVYI